MLIRDLYIGFIKISLLISSLILASSLRASDDTCCNTIESCIALIPAIEGKARGAGKVDDAVRDKLKSFGRDALLPLAKLTGEDNPNRRKVADSLIADIKDLNVNDFSIIQHVIQNNIELNGGGGWSYGALGYVGGDNAGKYLVSELKRVQSASNQIGTAFNRLGVEGIPYLIEGLRCYGYCSEEEFRGFSEVFYNYQRWTKISDDKFALQLFSLATNEKINLHARHTALTVIGYLTESPLIAKQIHQYAEKNIEFSGSALMSLQNMKSSLATEMLVNQLTNEKNKSIFQDRNFMVFNDLSELGTAGKNAGGRVMQFLNSEHWEDRINASLTLGYIGYFQAIPELRKQLSNPSDWQQVYAAVKALRLLSDKTTLVDLERVATNHWFKPLREYAEKAVVAIKMGKEYDSISKNQNLASDFFDYQQLGEENHTCDITDYPKVSESVETKQYNDKDNKLAFFQYKDPMCSNKEFYQFYSDYCSSDESILVPAIAAKYGENWLIGDNRGEWGGELVVFQSGRLTDTLLTENIEDVYVVGEFAYVITGLAHMSLNNGLIYKLQKTNAGYFIQPFYRLPGAPRTSWKISDDSILINTVSGAVIFNPSDGLKMANCK
ncbi:HEAT repeat domain-containing protein [Pseudoalteromonas shioyasakiensis]|uniref:HEAT repeat domain-containing protein n=1 Tax=Pseudoalteromonas shioyasakiensis TaxID=1190813 RepID=UPI002551F341|nr:HEAT repeat domain-containing protein [Pseudoalteromonas shioyasakiensis]MDK9684373.1 HEAT repeat domain-containing protein [Pseudoalteromonas shioyasakiensis]